MQFGTPTAAYDSDQESIDLDLPNFGIENEGTTKQGSQGMDVADIINMDRADMDKEERMEEVDKELQLFSLEEYKPPTYAFGDIKGTCVQLQPPGVPFFTLAATHSLYSPATLNWPFSNITEVRGAFYKMEYAKIKESIIDGFFQRQYASKRKPTQLARYLFHLMCCTRAHELMHYTFRTLCFVVEANSLKINIFNDILLALANLGGDLSKLGKAVPPSTLSSSVIPEEEQRVSQGTFKENKALILEFVALHLFENEKYSVAELDDLMRIVLAIALDPVLLESDICRHVSNAISHLLNLYPSNENFSEKILSLVEHITVYCEFNHHTVTYLCAYYITGGGDKNKTLRSSLAYLQSEISLQKEKKDILEFVEVEDVMDLVLEQLHIFSKETDSYLLHSVVMLLDICIGDQPLQSKEKDYLREICDHLEPVIQKRKNVMDDQIGLHLKCFTNRIMIKWKQKVGETKRQQTLPELNSNFGVKYG